MYLDKHIVKIVVTIGIIFILNDKFVFPFFQKVAEQIAAKACLSNFRVARYFITSAFLITLPGLQVFISSSLLAAYVLVTIANFFFFWIYLDAEKEMAKAVTHGIVPLRVQTISSMTCTCIYTCYFNIFKHLFNGKFGTPLCYIVTGLILIGLHFGICLTTPTSCPMSLKNLLAVLLSKMKVKALEPSPVTVEK